MTTPPFDLDALIRRSTLADMAPAEAIEYFGVAVDTACDAKQVAALEHLAKLEGTIARDQASAENATLLDYYLANVWNCLKYMRGPHPGGSWEWEQPEVESELTCLRRALQSPGLFKLPLIRACQVTTNLANCYNTAGRFVEAVRTWTQALRMIPEFGMAKANRASGLLHYARAVYDEGHAITMARQAWKDLDPALLEHLEPGAADHFAQVRVSIEAVLPPEELARVVDLNGFSLGDSEVEVAYRRWCLDQCLFLNPLNDLADHAVAGRDILTAPSIVSKIGEGPRFHGFFNQIKQEYCSARWLAYSALHATQPHFSDRDVLLYNTLDYPCYSLSIETMKVAFRAAYSLFDKIAYFLNAYLQLGIPEKAISFRNLWYVGQQRKKGIRPEFHARANWPLRGLFWLAKDLYEESPGFRAAIDPDAERLNQVRNQLEHKYLKVHDSLWAGPGSGLFKDDLASSVYKDELESMSLRLLALVRAAIIYLSLGVHQEERARRASVPPDQLIPPMFLDTWEDDWKR